jgi:hypothetical protein
MARRLRRDEDELEEEPVPQVDHQTSGPIIIDYSEEPSFVMAAVDEDQVTAVSPTLPPPDSAAARALTTTSPPMEQDELQESIEAVRLLTALLVGGAIEGADQLVTRLRDYEEELELLAAAETAQRIARGDLGQVMPEEDELDRLRFAVVGFVFEAQSRLGQGIYRVARLADTTLETADNVSKPFRNFFLFRPITNRIEARVEGLIEYGRGSVGRWTATGRDLEPRSRALATRTYEEIVDEFINMLAENEEIKQLVATQGISLVEEVRDNVRGRTVTGDSVVEEVVRRILRRPPREDLPEPPPEVQRWAGVRVSSNDSNQDSTS